MYSAKSSRPVASISWLAVCETSPETIFWKPYLPSPMVNLVGIGGVYRMVLLTLDV